MRKGPPIIDNFIGLIVMAIGVALFLSVRGIYLLSIWLNSQNLP